MKAIVIGDLHGEINFYHEVKSSTKEKLILTGDLLDSFYFSRTEQFKLLELVLNDIERGTTECVFGNHELSYLMRRMRCSGYASSFDAKIIALKSRMWKLMKPFILDKENKVLITHAGLNSQLLREAFETTPDLYEREDFIDLIEFFLQESWRSVDDGLVYNIGMSRGGVDQNAGIFWSDFAVDFNPVEGLTQIFGHTPVTKIKQKGSNWDIDCLQFTKQVVKLDGNQVEVISYEKPETEAGRSEGPPGIVREVDPFRPTESSGRKTGKRLGRNKRADEDSEEA
jgi:hypothetical protein